MRFANDIQKQLYYRSQIDYCYYQLKDLSIVEKRTPIDELIDLASGYEKAKNKKFISTAKSLLKTIIKCKTALELDYSGDEKALQEIQKLKP